MDVDAFVSVLRCERRVARMLLVNCFCIATILVLLIHTYCFVVFHVFHVADSANKIFADKIFENG